MVTNKAKQNVGNVPKARYADVMMDITFKKIFSSKQMLLDLINAIIKGHQVIDIQEIQMQDNKAPSPKSQFTDLSFDLKERFNPFFDSNVIMDIVCKTDKGETIVIEMQRYTYRFFHKRALVYASYEICAQEQSQNKQRYNVAPIYFIAFINYVIWEKDSRCVREFTLKDNETYEEYPDVPLRLIYIEIPKFTLSAEECHSRLDKVLYSIKHITRLKTIPKTFKNDEFIKKIFTFAEIERFTPEEKQKYKRMMDTRYDNYAVWQSAIDDAQEKGIAQGMERGVLQTAKNMLLAGVSFDVVVQCTGLTRKQVLALQK